MRSMGRRAAWAMAGSTSMAHRPCSRASSTPCRLFIAIQGHMAQLDRKSTRLNSSHLVISYAVFCLKKKKVDVFTNKLSLNVRSFHRYPACTVTSYEPHGLTLTN